MIADDHAIFREALRKLLESDREIEIVGEASSGTDCIKKVGELKPDILLLDLRMADKGGLAVLEELNFDSLPTQVIVLTAAEDNRDLVRAMRLGARGVVPKESAIDFLVKCIHRIHAGEIWLDKRLTVDVVDAFSASAEPGARSRKLVLSEREIEVVRLVAKGFQNIEIGKKLLISTQTVKNHLHNIFDKLGVSDRVELMLYAVHYRLIDEPDGSPTQPPLSLRTHK